MRAPTKSAHKSQSEPVLLTVQKYCNTSISAPYAVAMMHTYIYGNTRVREERTKGMIIAMLKRRYISP